MRPFTLILPSGPSPLLQEMIDKAINGEDCNVVKENDLLPDLREHNILFAIELNSIGISPQLNRILEELVSRGKNSLQGARGSILIHSSYNNFTKTAAQDVVFIANQLGCTFPGRPVIEANQNLDNYIPLQKIYNLPLKGICLQKSEELGRRLLSTQEYFRNKSIAVLHSSNKGTSNTYALWEMVREHLNDVQINEVYLGNGTISDCRGCSYKTCKYFGKQAKCFYGGIVVEEVYPAIQDASTIILLCPNYNDMLTANIVATINRLTALFRKTKFYDKKIFSIIVSGYSGGDALAKQLISSLNMNKTFELPPGFSIMATANDSGSIYNVPEIRNKAKEFARHIIKNL
ncbi:MAG: flavodoxin family protein [Bacillota bacterium]